MTDWFAILLAAAADYQLTVPAAITRLTHRLIDWLIPWSSNITGAVITRVADCLIGLLNDCMNVLDFLRRFEYIGARLTDDLTDWEDKAMYTLYWLADILTGLTD